MAEVEVLIRKAGEKKFTRTVIEKHSGFDPGAVGNCLSRARHAPPSSSAHDIPRGGFQSGGACSLSHRFAKYRMKVDGLTVN